jgi:hypothetical protein
MEGVKNIACIFYIIQNGDWFGSNQLSPLIAPILIGYFAASAMAVYYLSNEKEDPSNVLRVVRS